ncbi:hypothetical protein ABEB36_004596 [Hypothenemus hampei]|uniref:DDE Tnp4 domain-containing protein n=1 Tax=Hypothenemus hampei TaxID=57062 RepID=A0ABD1F4H8_HYPHA
MEKRKVATFLKLIQDIIESSESSDSEDEVFKFLENTRQKRCRISNYIDVINEYTEDQFKRNFRVQKNTASILISKVKQSQFYEQYAKEDHGGFPRLSSELYVYAFLWYAANKTVLRDVADRFGLGEATLYRIIIKMNLFFKELAKDVIKFPVSDEMKQNFERQFRMISGFPGVIGIVDGTSIPVRTPAKKNKSTYCNRHDQPAITLQGICDYKKRFIDVFTGPPGKIHDSRVFNLSFIQKNIKVICGDTFHLLGDSAYPLRPWLMTPYRDYGNLSEQQRNYNIKFCRTRVLIENTFGLLKTRFRQLMRLEFHSVEKSCNFIIACCVLHNLCIDNNDFIDEEGDDVTDEGEEAIFDNNDREMLLKQLGELKRNDICQMLNC